MNKSELITKRNETEISKCIAGSCDISPLFPLELAGYEHRKGNFSDNFFTLLPGEEKVLEIGDLEFNPNNLLIWSLYDLNKN